jgi:D,D-heptose 1,7-bisphosphate phosphatase
MNPAWPAVFLDKDGTLIADVPYNVDPHRMTLMPGTGAGLRRLAAMGYKLLAVSNQPGVALGYFSPEALGDVARRLTQLLLDENVVLDGFYYCPHHPDGTARPFSRLCTCRKPMPGMLLRAAAEHDIDLRASWMIGDILDDVEAGCRAGCRTLLIDNGNETVWHRSRWRWPTATAPDLDAASLMVQAALPSVAPSVLSSVVKSPATPGAMP